MAIAPLQRNNQVDALYSNEALALLDEDGRFHVAANTSFAGRSDSQDPSFANPLSGGNADSAQRLQAPDATSGTFFVFVPQTVVKACIDASVSGAAPPALDVTVFFDPFSSNQSMFDAGLRSIFTSRAGENKALICVPGNEHQDGGGTVSWGNGITNAQITALLALCNAGYSTPRVSTLAAWSAGWKGMVATMRATGRVSDIVEMKGLQRVIFYDCLYFTGGSQGLVDDALTKVQARISAAGSGQQLQVIAYLSTPGGNDSLDPTAIAKGIPFIKKYNLVQGLIVLNDSLRLTLRQVCIVRAMAWANAEGALPGFRIPGVLQSAFDVVGNTPRGTIRSLGSLPYGKGSPSGTDLASFAADPRNAPITRLNAGSTEFQGAVATVIAGNMIFSGTFPPAEVDHMVIMPELAWEFLAG